EGGVTDYSFEQCWSDYRRMVLGCLIYPITVCGTLDLANERGQALAECMLERNLSAISDLGSAELLK
ncbi:MAG: aminoglycoside phosphotransferase, partial [Gammaproteobacteria bacterium]|nr:aminoglycoside phosphotransferase [Gammaproteobacteria bacterium]